MEIKNYHVVYIVGDSFPTERPEAKRVYVIHWEKAGVVIPWPKGLTARQAIIEWAKFQARMSEGSSYKPTT